MNLEVGALAERECSLGSGTKKIIPVDIKIPNNKDGAGTERQ